jgi:hypothetical protein
MKIYIRQLPTLLRAVRDGKAPGVCAAFERNDGTVVAFSVPVTFGTIPVPNGRQTDPRNPNPYQMIDRPCYRFATWKGEHDGWGSHSVVPTWSPFATNIPKVAKIIAKTCRWQAEAMHGVEHIEFLTT